MRAFDGSFDYSKHWTFNVLTFDGSFASIQWMVASVAHPGPLLAIPAEEPSRMMRLRIDPRDQGDLHLSLALFLPVAAGLALFGWRCLGVWAVILAAALATRFALSRLRTWPAAPRTLALATQAIVVGLFCPATLFEPDLTYAQADARWPALAAVGLLLAVLNWLFRRLGSRRANAAVWTAAVLSLAMPWLVQTDRVLQPHAAVVGDVLDGRILDRSSSTAEPWMDLPRGPERVIVTPAAAPQLQTFLRGRPPAGRPNQTVARLLSDDLPPLEDLVIGGNPSAIGQGSVVALLIGGLLLVYRGLTPLRVPAMALLFCYLTLIVLPMPAGVGGGGTRRWLFERDPRVGWAAGLTLVNYVLLASTIPLVTTFVLPQPVVRPLDRGSAAGFAIVFGVMAAVGTVFVSVTGGPLVALVFVQLLWPARRQRVP